ncbi:unnamed protein product [Spirodela intermedia]|uniref:Uncharacterized protein n=1 Tax=Spirodela intermedia TaxID=51605 RepID=A0A7I8L3A6_SPIIN|nr:unnamed protein product [Spirodela intermedia]
MDCAREPAEEEERIPPPGEASGGDEEELFEIDLEKAVHRKPPARKQPLERGGERHHRVSGRPEGAALLANCILPASYICSAVPVDKIDDAVRGGDAADVMSMERGRIGEEDDFLHSSQLFTIIPKN